jgi:hypothetical protein
MHCDRCLKAAELEQLEPVGPFGEKMCGDCRDVFATAAASCIDCGGDAELCDPTGNPAHERRPRPSSSAPAPVIDGAHAFGAHMVEWRD